jgi:putative ABC transport system permease protein
VMINLPYSKDGPLKNGYFKSKVTQIPGVLSASLCNEAPSSWQSGSSNFTYEDHAHPEDFEVGSRFADSDYLRTFHIKLAAGRYPYPSDTVKEVLLNETVVRRLGFKSPSDVVGNYIHWGNLSSPRLPIVGVVRDFNSGSLREKISPLILVTASQNYFRLAVKLDPAAAPGIVKKIQKIFNEEYPGQFYDQAFFEDTVVSFYNAEAIASKLFKIFSSLAIFISCLGLYGLVSFMAIQKTKEVGIRKVLGASIQNIVYIFSKEFTILIGIAFLIAAPLGYYFMSQWLSAFYYHMDIGIGVFAIAILLSLVIAWITVGNRAVRAAVANPVKSLRSE